MTSAVQRDNKNRSGARRYVSWLLFLLLCTLIALVGLKLTFVVEDRWGHDAFIRWGGLTGFTLGLFGLFVSESEKLLRRQRFWILTAILLGLHLIAFAVVLTHVGGWKLPWFMVMVPEYPAFLFFRERFVSLA